MVRDQGAAEPGVGGRFVLADGLGLVHDEAVQVAASGVGQARDRIQSFAALLGRHGSTL